MAKIIYLILYVLKEKMEEKFKEPASGIQQYIYISNLKLNHFLRGLQISLLSIAVAISKKLAFHTWDSFLSGMFDLIP